MYSIANIDWSDHGLLIFIGIAFTIFLLYWLSRESPRDYPYEKSGPLLSRVELDILNVLQDAVKPEPCLIFSKVELADICGVRMGSKDWEYHNKRLKGIDVDFLICDSENAMPLIAIEIRDNAKPNATDQPRDHFLASVCQASKLRLLSLTCSAAEHPEAVHARIQDALAETLTDKRGQSDDG